ncbi:uncharacterized protein VTP21DRAFT_830 [Calcarisporiella thermophila]|uniref:uncharacterized protein n=1 Tax=Calcarisporiella thermophila TaxID=911321 RepID=UPI00374470F8
MAESTQLKSPSPTTVQVSRTASTGSVKEATTRQRSGSLINKLGNASKRSLTEGAEDNITQFSLRYEDYEIKSPIGYGSSAVVYNAIYKPWNKRVAIKMIDLDMFERNQIDELRRETQVMSLCKHPNVLKVYGAFVHESKLYIVTPYLSGGSCLDIMRKAFPEGFDEITIATILKQALLGLEYLHKNGHIHRDVKAGNLLMDEEGTVLLGDFGVSSSLMESGERKGQRKTFVGTPCWIAPEVMEQNGYDYKADIWSFGITAIELATGHAPYAKYPPMKVIMLTLSNDPPTLERESTKHKFSKTFKDMIETCLQKDPTKRPSAERLLQHPFFKQAKKRDYLTKTLLHNLPQLELKQHNKVQEKQPIFQKGVSWDFGGEDPPSLGSYEPQVEPTIEIEKPHENPLPSAIIKDKDRISPGEQQKHIAFVPGDVVVINKNRPGEGSAPVNSSNIPASALPQMVPKKSRFVIEDDGRENAPRAVGGVEPGGNHSNPAASQPQHISVRKGRFSVTDGDRPVTPQSDAGEGIPMRRNPSSEINSERRTRLEHYPHPQLPAPLSISSNWANASGSSMRDFTPTSSPSSASLSNYRDGSGANLSREGSLGRMSRFSVETSVSGDGSSGTSHLGIGKKGRFEISSVAEKRHDPAWGSINTTSSEAASSSEGGSVEDSPSVSPHGSLSRGQALRFDPATVNAISSQLEILMRQNEAQRQVLTELVSGIGLKPVGTPHFSVGGGHSPPIHSAHSSSSRSERDRDDHPSKGGIAMQRTGSGHHSNMIENPSHIGPLQKQIRYLASENEHLRIENEHLRHELERLYHLEAERAKAAAAAGSAESNSDAPVEMHVEAGDEKEK